MEVKLSLLAGDTVYIENPRHLQNDNNKTLLELIRELHKVVGC